MCVRLTVKWYEGDGLRHYSLIFYLYQMNTSSVTIEKVTKLQEVQETNPNLVNVFKDIEGDVSAGRIWKLDLNYKNEVIHAPNFFVVNQEYG